MRKIFLILLLTTLLILAPSNLKPSLTLGEPQVAGTGQINVPVWFFGENISAIVFSLETQNLTVAGYGASTQNSVYFNPQQNRIDVAIYESSYPFQSIESGTLLTLTFTITGSPASIRFSNNPLPSFGGVNGSSVQGYWYDHPSIDVQRFGLPRTFILFFPLVR